MREGACGDIAMRGTVFRASTLLILHIISKAWCALPSDDEVSEELQVGYSIFPTFHVLFHRSSRRWDKRGTRTSSRTVHHSQTCSSAYLESLLSALWHFADALALIEDLRWANPPETLRKSMKGSFEMYHHTVLHFLLLWLTRLSRRPQVGSPLKATAW